MKNKTTFFPCPIDEKSNGIEGACLPMPLELDIKKLRKFLHIELAKLEQTEASLRENTTLSEAYFYEALCGVRDSRVAYEKVLRFIKGEE